MRAAQLGQQKRLVALLAATLLFASAFLCVKGVEYEQKWKHGLLWGKRYKPAHETVEAARSIPEPAAARRHGELTDSLPKLRRAIEQGGNIFRWRKRISIYDNQVASDAQL